MVFKLYRRKKRTTNCEMTIRKTYFNVAGLMLTERLLSNSLIMVLFRRTDIVVNVLKYTHRKT